jgi:hypothetical protein
MACQPSGSITPGAKEEDRVVGSPGIFLIIISLILNSKKQKPPRTLRGERDRLWLLRHTSQYEG